MKKIFMVLFVIFWMGFIYHNSATIGDESNKKSYSIVNKVDKIKENTEIKNSIKEHKPINKIESNQKLNRIIRKNAHLFEYLVLGILLCVVLFLCSSIEGKHKLIYILFICLFYAVTDEFHQNFVQGRSSSVSDVLIDFSGSVFGIIIYLSYKKVQQLKGGR
ncbi:VanZ family protein [Clostridium botulinum]|uniref:Phorsphotransbutyrlylase n=1 Tax=Clostridium botulinum TaxID=1491 RepID=A0A9Q1UZC9_CLOBO|nr:VanZ family protein [Clostridium botulinum]AEB75399.1 probable phorsphotransbutyrlylase [Clostridium botulinum BKT015925]KEH99916.1 phorsphotransbutyrlylase [Clostridium botulinum D str. 16868]KEI03764.1 phorsphotransbutyrlylase [Clostridium botulinum C/D str. Sp77]KLU76363.1 phorsphotransbutyrlylase [Clostridium botulinum V891]KOA73633.1 phorsphotransbutyrlylase [Clostridium botulinum]